MISKGAYSGAPACQRHVSGAPYQRKLGNRSERFWLSCDCPSVRLSVCKRPYAKPKYKIVAPHP